MHRLLKRQLRKFIHTDSGLEIPKDFIDAINLAYEQTDADRKLIERSLDLTSQESLSRFHTLQEQFTSVEKIKQKLESTIHQLKTTMDAGFDGIVLTDIAGNPLSFNRVALDMSGLSEGQFKELNYESFTQYILSKLTHPHLFTKKMSALFKDSSNTESITLGMKGGSFFDVKGSKVYKDGKVDGMVWSVRDITELKKREQEAEHRASHDELTELANRTLFLNVLESSIAKAKRNNTQLAVVFLDLDNFKYVNDTYGHPFGDELLVQIANRLNDILRASDLCARFSGDEFVIMLEDISKEEDILPLIKRLQHSLSVPFRISKTKIQDKTYVTTSLGVAVYPTDAIDAENLISKADMAMYNAKRNGRDTFRFYSPQLETYSRHQLSMQNDLRNALENDDFQLVYQPKIDAKDNSICGVEALIRWEKDGELIPPNNFIKTAETNGMITQIDRWVIMRACQNIGQWFQQGTKPVPVSINISPVHFQHGNLLDELQTYCAFNKVPTNLLIIEITEGSFIGNIESAIKKIEQLNQAGFRVSIDDFGTGYSSFTYLSSLPVTELKIDRSFITKLTQSKKQSALVGSIIDMAHAFELSVVAEGVESLEEIEILKSFDCDCLQGYYFYKPLAFETLSNKLESATLPSAANSVNANVHRSTP